MQVWAWFQNPQNLQNLIPGFFPKGFAGFGEVSKPPKPAKPESRSRTNAAFGFGRFWKGFETSETQPAQPKTGFETGKTAKPNKLDVAPTRVSKPTKLKNLIFHTSN